MKEITATLSAITPLPPGQQFPLLLSWIPQGDVESSSCLFMAHTKGTQQLFRVRWWICCVSAIDLHSGTFPPQTLESYEQRQNWHFSLASNLLTGITEKRRTCYFLSLSNYCSADNLFLSTSIVSLRYFESFNFSCINIKIVLDFKLHTHTAKSWTWENGHIEFCIATGMNKKHTSTHTSVCSFQSNSARCILVFINLDLLEQL